MSKSRKKGTGEVQTLADWAAVQVLAEEELHRLVAKQIEGLLASLERTPDRLPYGIRERKLAVEFRTKVQALLVWAEVWHSLAAGNKSPAEIALPLPLTEGKGGVSFLDGRPADVPSPEPWLIYGLTEEQWGMSIHDVLTYSAVAGSVAASGAISKARIQTVGDFYELWQGADLKIFARIPDFRQGRLRIVKQALMEAKIPWPVWANVSAAKLGNLIKDKPWEDFILTEAQWGTALADILVHDSRGNTYQSVRVRNILAKAGCVTVGELYLFCRGRKKDLLDLKGMSETRLTVLDDAMKAAGISPLSQW